MIEQTALATLLHERLTEWDKARKGQEQKLLECYQDVMRIPRDDDTAGTGVSKTRKTQRLFMGSTRNKVRSSRAKIKDSLFGNGKLPFDTSPTNDDLAPYADVMEDILTEQLQKMDFKSMLGNGVNTLATYGTGFMFGPFVRQETKRETAMVDGILTETEYPYDAPYYELGNTLDIYPDPEARVIEDGLGVFWVTMMSPHTVKEWRGNKGYRHIDGALLSPSDSGSETGSARSEQLRGNIEYWHENDRIKVARYFGKIPKHSLSVWNESHDVHDTMKENASKDDDMIDAIVIMAGGVIVRVDESPWNRCPTLRCVYEEVEHEIWGVGPAENNSPHQKVINAAFRLFMEGKGLALLGTASVDRSKFMPGEDFKKFPGKIYQMKPGLSGDERKEAIIFHQEPDVTGGWLDVIQASENFSDDDTGVNKYTQGDDSKNLNKTAHGISMIMAASSLPLKEVLEHIDSMWIEPMIEALIEWNIKYLTPETVQKIHGDKEAQIWAEIKQFGKSSFMDWQATGTSSFMQKEVLVSKIQAFSAFALSTPMTASKVDPLELLNQTWDAMEIGKESPILKDEAQQQIPPEVQAHIQQLEQALVQAHDEHQRLENEVKTKAGADQAKMASDGQQREADRQAAVQKAQIDAQAKVQMARDKQAADLELARIKAETEQKIAAAEIRSKEAIAQYAAQMKQDAENARIASQPQPEAEPGGDTDIAALLKVLAAPKEVIRDASGKVTGVRAVVKQE